VSVGEKKRIDREIQPDRVGEITATGVLDGWRAFADSPSSRVLLLIPVGDSQRFEYCNSTYRE